MEDESDKKPGEKPAEGYVDFEHVAFGYEGTDREIIHDFSASARPGQKIAIVGPSGSGKSTLVNLLMRFHEIQKGKICIDGVSTKDMRREDVHAQFCMVLQDTWLFEGTVRENLIYCTEGVDDAKMEAACKAVGLDHFIRTLPQGYDTVLNDQVNLSQGQKQQLTIARAMIADKPMLILDEATSSVDTRTELQIQNAMDELMKNRTSFVIAHRLSTIKKRRPHPGDEGRRHRGAGQPRAAAGKGRLLRRPLQLPVRGRGVNKQAVPGLCRVPPFCAGCITHEGMVNCICYAQLCKL